MANPPSAFVPATGLNPENPKAETKSGLTQGGSKRLPALVPDATFSTPKGAGSGARGALAGIGAGIAGAVGSSMARIASGIGGTKEAGGIARLITLTEVANRQRAKLVSLTTSAVRMARAAAFALGLKALGKTRDEKIEDEKEAEDEAEKKDGKKEPGWFKKLGGFLGGTKIGKVGKAGLVGLLWVGIIQVVLEAIRFYLENLRGKSLGDWMDVLDSAKIGGLSVGGLLKAALGGGIGFIVGKLVGGVIGAAFGGPVGMMLGAFIGGIIGAGIGALVGYFTSTDMYKGLKENIKTWWEGMKTNIFNPTGEWAKAGVKKMAPFGIHAQLLGLLVGSVIGLFVGVGNWISTSLIGDSLDPLYRMVGRSWDLFMAGIRLVVREVSEFFYQPGEVDVGGGVGAGTILGGTISLQFIQDIKHLVSNAWDNVSNFVSNIVKSVSDFFYTGPEVDVGGGVTRAKIFGGLVELHPEGWGAYFKEKWEGMKKWFHALVKTVSDWMWTSGGGKDQAGVLFNTFKIPTWSAIGTAVSESWDNLTGWASEIMQTVADWMWTGGEPGSGKAGVLFNYFTIPTWSAIGTAVSESWDNLKDWSLQLVKDVAAWIWTSEKTDKTGVTTGAKIFGFQLPSLPSPGDVILAGWKKLTEWVTGIGTWFWDGEALFGSRFTIPDWKMPEFPTMEEMKNKLFAIIATIISKIPDMILPQTVIDWRDKYLPGALTAGEIGRQKGAAKLRKQYDTLEMNTYAGGVTAALAAKQEKEDAMSGRRSGSASVYGDFAGNEAFSGLGAGGLALKGFKASRGGPDPTAAAAQALRLQNIARILSGGNNYGTMDGDDSDPNSGSGIATAAGRIVKNMKIEKLRQQRAGEKDSDYHEGWQGWMPHEIKIRDALLGNVDQNLTKTAAKIQKDGTWLTKLWGNITSRSTPHMNVKIVDTLEDPPFVRIARGRDAAIGATKSVVFMDPGAGMTNDSPPITIVNAPQTIDARQSTSNNSSQILAGVNDPFGDMIPGALGG